LLLLTAHLVVMLTAFLVMTVMAMLNVGLHQN
jgi:hypothetical protein